MAPRPRPSLFGSPTRVTHPRRLGIFITFLFPVTTNAADITALMLPRLDAVYIGSSPVGSMTGLNKQLNDLFKVAK
jgi:hypothetical protein